MTDQDRLAEIKTRRSLVGDDPEREGVRIGRGVLVDLDWLVGEVERLRIRVTYREQTIDKLKAELERNNQAFQRLIPEAEAADECRREVERLRGLLRQLQWTATLPVYGDGTEAGCPVCQQPRLPDGHAPGCWLAAEL